jgi:hypothetical protein
MKSFSAASLAAFLLSIVPVVSGAMDKKVLVDRSRIVGYIAGLRCAAKAGEIKTPEGFKYLLRYRLKEDGNEYLLPWTGTPNAKAAVHALEPLIDRNTCNLKDQVTSEMIFRKVWNFIQ